MPLWSKHPDTSHARYRAKHRKLPEERQMLCTDIEIPHDAPERAFVKAWNLIVSHRPRYLAGFKRIAAETDNALLRYRAEELYRMVFEGARQKVFDYALSLKALGHIEVTPDGKLAVIFLTGTRITNS